MFPIPAIPVPILPPDPPVPPKEVDPENAGLKDKIAQYGKDEIDTQGDRLMVLVEDKAAEYGLPFYSDEPMIPKSPVDVPFVDEDQMLKDAEEAAKNKAHEEKEKAVEAAKETLKDQVDEGMNQVPDLPPELDQAGKYLPDSAPRSKDELAQAAKEGASEAAQDAASEMLDNIKPKSSPLPDL